MRQGRRDRAAGRNQGMIMKSYAVPLAAATLLLAGCNRASEGQLVENTVRGLLAGQGTVQSVSLTKGADNNYSGPATVRRADGAVIRLNCTARRTSTAGNFDILCGQVLDQALIDEIKTAMRNSLTAQNLTVSQLEVSRQDDDHVTGFAEVADASGQTTRLTCTASRQSDGRFNGGCEGGEAPATAAAPAPGDEPAEAPPAEAR